MTAGVATAPPRIDGEFSFGGQEHFYLKTQAAWAEAGEDGTVTVNSSIQHPSKFRRSLASSQPILDRARVHLDNADYLPAVHFTGRVAKTTTPSPMAFRGFGGLQGMFVIEEIVDRVSGPADCRPKWCASGISSGKNTHELRVIISRAAVAHRRGGRCHRRSSRRLRRRRVGRR